MRNILGMAALTILILVLFSSFAHPLLPHIRSQLDKANSPCPSRLSAESNHNRIGRRSIGDPNRFAIYVNGSIGLRLGESAWKRFASRIRSEFSLEMWLQIEGGQPDSATIFGATSIRYFQSSYPLGDICGKANAAASVRLAIQTEAGGEHKARIVAQLATQMANQPTTLKSVSEVTSFHNTNKFVYK
ncbi:unnamed protein product [Toxocara canis]|uniref:LytR_C domain-containing protein n=1 Tax=Toxocara canis TaxID=6265 RepID=A0A183V8C4_TOXCA|nr:unnamed protein product [Toxocara canis]